MSPGDAGLPPPTTACPPTPPNDDRIVNFEDDDLNLEGVGTRGGTSWSVIVATDGATGSVSAQSMTSRCGSAGFMRFAGTSTETRSPIARALFRDEDDVAFFDARAYRGIRLWLRSPTAVRVRIKIPDRYTASAAGMCTKCSDHFAAEVSVTPTWQLFTLPFDQLSQLGEGDPRPAIDRSGLWGLEIVSPRNAPFQVDVDDIVLTR